MKILSVYLAITGMLFSFAVSPAQAAASGKPQRIVSLNLCADQLLLELADPGQIAALTHLSHEPDASVHYQQARQFPAIRALAEEVLPLKPDLVISGEYGNPSTTALLKQLGLRLETLPLANSLEAVQKNIALVARLSGHPGRGQALITEFQQRLAQLPPPQPDAPLAAVYDANGYTVGAASLRGQMLKAAGWRNAGEALGIRSYGTLSLEAMVRLAPDALIDSPYSTAYSRARALSLHPALRGEHLDPQVIRIPSAMTMCGGPWTAQLIEQLATQREAR